MLAPHYHDLDGPGKGGYHNPYFVRGKPALCCNMKRMKVKGVANTSSMGILAAGVDGSSDRSETALTAPPSTLRTEKPSAVASQQMMSQGKGSACTPSSFGVNHPRHSPRPSWLRDHESSLLEFARQQVVHASIREKVPSTSPTSRSSPVNSLTASSDGSVAMSSSRTTDDEIVDELISTFLS